MARVSDERLAEMLARAKAGLANCLEAEAKFGADPYWSALFADDVEVLEGYLAYREGFDPAEMEEGRVYVVKHNEGFDVGVRLGDIVTGPDAENIGWNWELDLCDVKRAYPLPGEG